jgi:hypothetical protein
MRLALGCVLASAGAAMLLGALLRWRWLVDPPESEWPVYSQALFKKLLGPIGLLIVTYVQGYVLIVLGVRLVASAFE